MSKNEGQTGKVKQETPVSTLQGVICSNPGEHIAPVYKRVYSEELKKNVVTQVDTIDVFEFIQGSASQTDFATLQKRFIALGEIPSVDPTLGSNDLTLFPQDIHGVYNMVNNVNEAFAKLPENVRVVFGTAAEYQKALLDGTYMQKIISVAQAQQVPGDTGKDVNEHE